MLIDPFKRKIEYLRFSVTDLCNIRCLYCMPLEWGAAERTTPPYPPEWPLRTSKAGSSRDSILNFEEIERMVAILAGLGVKKVRLTGGEPLVRRGIAELVGRIWRVRGVEEVLLTTNGILLKALAAPLRDAGLEKINIHLDTLSAETFRRISRGAEIERVFEGIAEARRVGFSPIKMNVVLQRGMNDHEVEDLVRFASREGLIVRFIELMPIGPGREMMTERFISAGEIRQRLEKTFTLHPSLVKLGGGPAKYYEVAGWQTKLGFITPVSEPFCDRCNRIRISSDGRFQDCLAYDGSFSFRDLLRNPSMTDENIEDAVKAVMMGKRESHEGFVQEQGVRTPCMIGIGG